MTKRKHYFFATHLTDGSIKTRLRVGAECQQLKGKEKALLDELIEDYKTRDRNYTVINYCEEFIKKHQSELKNLQTNKGYRLKYFLRDYIGFVFKWNSSTKSYGKNSEQFAEIISELDLVNEMTNPNGSIKELLEAAGEDKKMVKPFLPAVMISLNTNTRDKSKMIYEHTGKFVFDFDKIGDEKKTVNLMNMLWNGTKNIKPYMAFVSPSENGFKLFCQVDNSSKEFQDAFGNNERNTVIEHHKLWYLGALDELKTEFPEVVGIVDEGTNDPTRLTYIPFISKKNTHFIYDPSLFSDYNAIVNIEKTKKVEKQKKELNKNKVSIKKVMKENGIKSEIEAYHIWKKNKAIGFDVKFEMDKFQKVVEFMVAESKNDASLNQWMKDTFTSYETLVILNWVLYGVFGDMATEEIKKLIPKDSNKLDSTHGDYRWSHCDEHNYSDDKRASLTPAYFYSLAFQNEEVKSYILRNFPLDSKNISEFNRLHSYYDNFKFDLQLGEDKGDKSEFLKMVTSYINNKKNRLPLIKELEETSADVDLGPNDYLDKKVMEDIFQKKYADKKVFMLRSQCGK
tara:strand:- start:45 stop:1748 length:1704 start_codon:yes stop_codon:yes gene_type:complete